MSWTFDSRLPIYLQIVQRLEKDIVSGRLEKGGRIKSVRELAEEAAVNPNTMQRAMQELENAGLVTVQRGNGRFVTEDDAVINAVKKRLAREYVITFTDQMENLGFSREEIIQILNEE